MAKSLLVVFGATGNQGNSTANAVLNDSELSQRYTVRAVSRDVSNPKMHDLKSKGAELAQADMDDPASLPAALNGAEYMFFMTNTQYQGNTREVEMRQAQTLCSEAVKQGVKYIINSSMSHPFKITNGKLKNVEHFDCKAEIEEYIRGLPVKSAFYAPGSFMSNLQTQMRPRPSPANDGTFVIGDIANDDTVIPFIDITDTGKWIAAILADPEKYEGKFFAAAGELLTLAEACAVVSTVTGKTVKHHQLPEEIFKGFFPPALKEQLFEMWELERDYGYFGPDMKELVGWATAQARGKPNTLEEYLRNVDFNLD